jgi:hypothetical protein
MKKLRMFLMVLALLVTVLPGSVSSANSGTEIQHVQDLYKQEVNQKKLAQGAPKVRAVKAETSSRATAMLKPVLTNPVSFDTNVPVNHIIRYQFLQKITIANKNNITLWDSKKLTKVPIEAAVDHNTLYVVPKQQLAPFNEYFAVVDTGAIKGENGAVNDVISMVFTTSDKEAPLITKILPFEGQTDVSTRPVITVTFDRTIQTGQNNIVLLDSNQNAIPIGSTVDNNKLLIAPTVELAKNSYYTIVIASGAVKDRNNLENFMYVTFFSTKADSGNPEPAQPDLSITIEYKESVKVKLSGGRSPYTATSANKSVATVSVKDNYVTIKGAGKGQTTVTIKDKKGNTKQIQVNVLEYTVKW